MGRGQSGLSKGGGGSGKPAAPPKPKTPSGIDYQQFISMSDDAKYNTIQNIIKDNNITVPSYLDASDTSKVMYALGMNNKPTVVSDVQLDTMPGQELFRTVYEDGIMPPPSTADILDQIRNGDYTQMSGKGGSAHGRAIYFATNFKDSADYGSGRRNPLICRSKINPGARIVDEYSLRQMMRNDKNYSSTTRMDKDAIALYALSNGIDGWKSGTYTMIVNRGVLTTSSLNKHIQGRGRSRGSLSRFNATSWQQAVAAT